MKAILIAAGGIFIALPAVGGDELAQFQLDAAQKRVIGLSHLYEDSSCTKAQINGVVVKREFAPDALRVVSFVVESGDGRRQHVNVDVDPDRMNMNQRGWILAGLQSLLKEGRRIEGTIRLCGAAGSVSFLDTLR